MGLGEQTYALNDNSPLVSHGVDDRMGFHAFLREAKAAREREVQQENALLLETQDNAARRSLIKPMQMVGMIFLAGLILSSGFLLMTVTSPLIKILALNSLALSSLIMSARSNLGRHGRWHEVWSVIALSACFGVIYLFGSDFAVTGLKLSGCLPWVIMAGLALAVSRLIHSRTALILSLMVTAIWGCGLFTSTVALSPVILAFPVLAAAQFMVAEDSRDKSVRLSFQLMLSAWIIGAIYVAYMSGAATAPMLITAVGLTSALIYAASTHPFKVWNDDPMKGTALLGWTGLIITVLMTAWFWISPEGFALPTAASPLSHFIWQIGIIGAVGMLFIISALRRARTSYSLSRRLLSAVVMALLPLSLFFQQDLQTYFTLYGLEVAPLYFAISCFAVVAALTLNKFISAIKFEHFGWMLVCTLIAIATIMSLGAVPEWTADLMAVTIIAALGTICALAWTQKTYAAPKTVYRPLKRKTRPKTESKNAAVITPSLKQAARS